MLFVSVNVRFVRAHEEERVVGGDSAQHAARRRRAVSSAAHGAAASASSTAASKTPEAPPLPATRPVGPRPVGAGGVRLHELQGSRPEDAFGRQSGSASASPPASAGAAQASKASVQRKRRGGGGGARAGGTLALESTPDAEPAEAFVRCERAACVRCSGEERARDYCEATGHRQEVTCIGLQELPDGKLTLKKKMLKTTFESCKPAPRAAEQSAESFGNFVLLMFTTLLASLYVITKRKRMHQAARDLRMRELAAT